MRDSFLIIRPYIAPAAWIILYQLVAAAIGKVTASNIDGWYAGLEKSALTPPDIAFPIVWTILYVLIATAGWQIWKHRREPGNGKIFAIFLIYTLLNWGWSFVFFGAHDVALGFFWILALNLVALILIVLAWKPVKKAALLMILPTLWTFFASFLNYQIWVLN